MHHIHPPHICISTGTRNAEGYSNNKSPPVIHHVPDKKEKAFIAIAINALSPYPVEFFDTHT